MLGDTALFIGRTYSAARRPCIFGFADDRLVTFGPRAEVLRRPGVHGGAAQPDGSVLFWMERDGVAAELLEVRGGEFIRYSFPGLRHIRGAAADGDFLYLAGDSGERSAVLRLPRRARQQP
jgi:hypothetical protein